MTNTDIKISSRPIHKPPFQAGDIVQIISESAWKGSIGIVFISWPAISTCGVTMEYEDGTLPIGFGWSELRIVNALETKNRSN